MALVIAYIRPIGVALADAAPDGVYVGSPDAGSRQHASFAPTPAPLYTRFFLTKIRDITHPVYW